MGIKDVKLDSGDKLPIREFKLEDMADYSAIVMVARRGSGKSWVCRSILKHHRQFPVGLIIAPTDKLNAFYADFFPESFIHYEYKSELIQKVLSRQDKIKMKAVEKKKEGKFIDTRCFLVMDDCLASSKTWMRDQPIKELLFNGRHYDIMYMLTMQAPLGVTPEMRQQFDYIFLFAEDFFTNLKKLYDHYAGMFPTFESFRQIFSKLTEDHCCMVIINTQRHKKDIATTGTFLDKIFWFKANEEKVATMGCKQFRQYHEKNFNPEWRHKSRNFDMNDYCIQKKKDKSSIKIEKVNE